MIRAHRWRGRGSSQGAVTVVMTAVCVLGIVLAFVALEVGVFVSERSHASAAADAAALAAADELARGHGSGAAARVASSVATANGARLVRCNCDLFDATVTVSFPSRLPLVPLILARAHATVDLSRAMGQPRNQLARLASR